MRERFFEKVSFERFKKDIKDDLELYHSYALPIRATKSSCGYDFVSIENVVIKPGEVVMIPTGYKAKFRENEVLLIVVRSSLGIRHNVRMCNQVAVVDSDYYNNEENEGHLFVVLQNEGERDFVLNQGDRYCQGIFLNFLTCGEDVVGVRGGGIGSTNRRVSE